MRVVIVGAGPNGLVCGAYLAQAGLEVVVLEARPDGYGGITSADGPLPGFCHDVCAGFFPLTVVSPAFKGLDLDIDWIRTDPVMAHPFRDGTALALRRDVDATAAGLGAAGPPYAAFMRRLVANWEPLMDAALAPPPPGRSALEAALGLRLDLLRLAYRSVLPAGFMGRHWLGNSRAAAWLAGSTAHSDLDPTSPGGGAFAITLGLLGHAVGWPFPRGGAEAIARALQQRIEAAGGSVRHGAAVMEVITAGQRASGVRLSDGERIDADAVVATVSATPLLAMLPAGALPAAIATRLRRWPYDAGTFKVDFALSAPVPWTAEECRRAGTIHVGDRLSDFTESLRSARDGRFPRRPTLVIGQHTVADTSRAPQGQHTLYCYVRSPLELDMTGDEAAGLVEAQIEEFAPGFRSTVLGRAIRTPQQMQEHNPSMIGGDLGGGSYQLHHQLVLRPHPRMWRTRTPIAGLYAAGASTHPGGGVHGTQGLEAARFILKG